MHRFVQSIPNSFIAHRLAQFVSNSLKSPQPTNSSFQSVELPKRSSRFPQRTIESSSSWFARSAPCYHAPTTSLDHILPDLHHHLSTPAPIRPNNFIHLIPILILLCFFILYLFSHIPSQSDLAQFNGFIRPSTKRLDSAEEEIGNLGELSRLIDIQKGDVLAIRILKNLQEIKKHIQKSRFHRKFTDF